jgi:type I restriction-modification system DNA methylase subunit
MTAPKEILNLVDTFERNIEIYEGQEYNEAQLRREFIDPFFETLGWDVTNKQQFAPAYRDVINEDAIKVGSATKAPDYCFRIGGLRKFFLEAKKPSINVEGDPHPSYQLRRYAWSAKLPLSILTNFEEFAVYDCQSRPNESDSSSAARIMFINFKDYPENWEKISGIFSKDSVLKGSFDKFITTAKTKKGTTTVDIAFLEEIENWRQTFAKTIAHKNLKLTVEQINYAVQKTVDRILFLRMCEDRGIEPYKQLLSYINGDDVYPRLCSLFEKADAKYNSGIFHFQKDKDRAEPPDELTLNLSIDDKDLKYIIHSLYYPKSPYEFSVLPPEILGNVYEQFLGKVIRLTEGRQVKIDEKPEVKKAGGIYYTPSYIVDYIVKNTVGKLCEGKSPKDIEKLKILDPACGSGSFLLGAYTYLLNYIRDWYVQNNPEKYKKQIYQLKAGQWFLTIEEKKKILLNNIFGVDIDQQAVEVTKLSLLLKTLENENQETLKLFHERALPDLGNNIKCGNSLIGPDYFENKDPSSIDPDEYKRINAFDWQKEFDEIFKKDGFNAIIGNPPYVRVRQIKSDNPLMADYFEEKYRCAVHVWDIYLLFFEKALSLVGKRGLVSFILPVQTLHQPNCESLRKILIDETTISKILNLSKIKVFQNAIVKNCIFVVENPKTKNSMISISEPASLENVIEDSVQRKWPQDLITSKTKYSLKTDLLSDKSLICDKIESKSVPLEDIYYVTFGLRSCAPEKGKGGKDRLITTDKKTFNAKPYLEGREIKRYSMFPTKRFIKYIPDKMYSPRDPKLFEIKKIISQTMLSKMKLIATLDSQHYYVEQSLLCVIPHGILTPNRDIITPKLEFVLGILNSKLSTFYYSTKIIDYSLGGGLIHATPGAQGKIPIRIIDFENPDDVKKHDKMVSLVEMMLDLNKKIQKEKMPEEKVRIQRQIDSTDRQIDKLVYDLYGLTQEEIDIVEDRNKTS